MIKVHWIFNISGRFTILPFVVFCCWWVCSLHFSKYETKEKKEKNTKRVDFRQKNTLKTNFFSNQLFVVMNFGNKYSILSVISFNLRQMEIMVILKHRIFEILLKKMKGVILFLLPDTFGFWPFDIFMRLILWNISGLIGVFRLISRWNIFFDEKLKKNRENNEEK